jgi:hypothetical protein
MPGCPHPSHAREHAQSVTQSPRVNPQLRRHWLSHERSGAPQAEPCTQASAALVLLLQSLLPKGERHDLRECGTSTLPLAEQPLQRTGAAQGAQRGMHPGLLKGACCGAHRGPPTNAGTSHDAPTVAEEEKARCP